MIDSNPILRDIILSDLTGCPMFPETKKIYDNIMSILSETSISEEEGVTYIKYWSNKTEEHFFFKLYNKKLDIVFLTYLKLKSIPTLLHLLEEHFKLEIDSYSQECFILEKNFGNP